MEAGRVVARETPADQRCPYCHDALPGADLGALLASGELGNDLVECDGCRTKHHRACIEELGRCTIRGCERSLHVAPATPLDQPIRAAELRSAVRREVERRLRERARGFVQAHARPVGTAGGRAEVEAAHEAGCAAEEAGDRVAASEAWHQVARHLTLARPEELQGVELQGLGSGWRLGATVSAQDVAHLAEAAVRRADQLLATDRWTRIRRVLGSLALGALALVLLIAATLGADAAWLVALASLGALALGAAMAAMVAGLLKGMR